MTHPLPTGVRYRVMTVTAVAAVFMYIDRVCLSQVSSDIQRELSLSPRQMDWVKSAFFWTYALAQVPAAALAGRIGLRNALAAYLFLWSLATGLTGLAGGFAAVILARLAVGVTEAGAYPTAAALMKNWFPVHRRGFANSMCAFGGRAGGASGQRITPALVLALAGVGGLSGWRNALVLFGLVGMAWAVVFWLVVRDTPADHPRSNAAEADLAGPPPPTHREPLPLAAMVRSRNLWLSGATQFGINVGWVFLITHLPDYLEHVHGLTGDAKGFWASLPLLVGMAGMFGGGFLTDALVRRLGLRWGRALPIGLSLFACAAAYGTCPFTGARSYAAVVLALCVMTVFVDLGVPAIWAFAQDIGGRHVGAAVGWGNMWGNVGAAVSPLLLGVMRDGFGWPAVFGTCAAAFAAAGCTAMLMDARRPVVQPPASM